MYLHIIPVSIARERGLKFYFNGKPCPFGHINSKYVSSGTCFTCSQAKVEARVKAQQQKADDKQLKEYTDWAAAHPECVRHMTVLPADRAEVIGSRFFYSGKPCPYGHRGERYVSGNARVECMLAKTIRNRDKKKEYNARKYRENPTRYVESIKAWVASNPARIKEKAARFYERHPEAKRAQTQRDRARRKGVEGRFSAADIRRLRERQRNRCACCKAPFTKVKKNAFHVDHIMPISGGGTNWPHNLQLLCPTCNLKKGAKDPIEFAASIGRLL